MGRNGESKKWERREAQGKIEDHSGICRERERLKKIEKYREKGVWGFGRIQFTEQRCKTGFRFLAGCLCRC